MKSWVVGCLNDSLETLVGYTKMHLFRFFVDLLGWLVMQYKVSPQILFGVPLMLLQLDYGKLIQLGHQSCIPKCPTLFHSTQFGAMMPRSMERKKIISVGLSKYIDFWKVGITQSSTYDMKMKPYVEEHILLHLSKLLFIQSSILWRASSLRTIGGLIMLGFLY